jgi:DNA gyrase/topoisomerase IV subunit A
MGIEQPEIDDAIRVVHRHAFEVLELSMAAENLEELRESLVARFRVTREQAEVICHLPFRVLTGENRRLLGGGQAD